MIRKLLSISCFFSSVIFLFTGCTQKSEAQQEHSIISGIDVGMTSEDVFSIMGKEYDNCFTEETYKNTIEYDYVIQEDNTFHTGLNGYMFFEFDSETDTLLTFGCHLGQKGDFDAPSFPYPEDELNHKYQAVKEILTDWYGEGTASSENTDSGAREEYIWQKENKQIWAIYGVNLWAMNEPEKYEDGVNEIIISCTSKF